MKKLLILALVTICAQHLYAQNHTVDEVIWVVGDEAILRSDVERMRTIYGNEIKGNPYCVIPEQLAIQKLFLHQAAIDSVSVSDGDVAPYVEQDINEKVMMAGSKEKLEEYMRMPMSQIREELFEQYKNEMTARQMKQKITAGIKITPAEVRRYFRDLPQDSLPFIPTQVEVQILTRHPRIRREEIERVKEQLRGWAERIQAGTTSFSALARMFSKDEGSARMGGELEYYGRTQLDPAFANVAFSNGSLPAGFLSRIQKLQPLSAPSDVRRYFVSPEESGQICLLSCILGENRNIFFPKLEEAQMMTFDAIGTELLKVHGYEVLECDSDEEAINKAEDLKNGSNLYPVHYSASDTSGEKPFEEFVTDSETADYDRFSSLGVITGKEIPDKSRVEKLFKELNAAFDKESTTKEEVIAIMKDYLPNFEHIETGKSLDSKM